MTKVGYVICFFIVLAILMACAKKIYGRKEAVTTTALGTIAIGATMVVLNIVMLLSDNLKVGEICYTIYFALHNILCYHILLYSCIYTTGSSKHFMFRWYSRVIIYVDSISILLNPVLGHALTFTSKEVNGEIYLLNDRTWIFYVHVLLCYMILFFAFLRLFVAWMKAPYMYRMKYSGLGVTLFFSLIIETIFLWLDLPVDLTIISFSWAAFVLVYFAYYYIPQKLQNRIQTQVLSEMSDALVVFDIDDTCIYANARARELFIKDDISLAEFREKWGLNQIVQSELKIEDEGFCHIYEIGFKDLIDNQWRRNGCYYLFHDVTEERRLLEEQQYLATHDTLTDVFTRQHFMETAEQLMKSYPNEKFIIICSDIRNFKTINDVYGEEVGDKILITLANSLKQQYKEPSVYGRIAGDSFGCCMLEKDFDAEVYLAERKIVLHELKLRYPIIDHIGIYKVENMGISVANMCDRALLAVQSIREDYQQEIAYYDQALHEKQLAEQDILRDFQDAFREEQFIIHLQPQIDYKTGKVFGAEALARWKHPAKGMISPGLFIPLMEQSGMIVTLDQMIWEQACRLLHRWREEGHTDRRLSVNISTKDFFYDDVYKLLTVLIRKYDLPPACLKLEITESAFSLDMANQIAVIERLQEEGFTIEMDDFGSGYSSLNTLKSIPVDVLKLDMAFLQDDDKHQRSEKILQTIVMLAEQLDLPVIAEGVETKEQAEFLSNIGCDYHQGYLYSKPMSVEEFEQSPLCKEKWLKL